VLFSVWYVFLQLQTFFAGSSTVEIKSSEINLGETFTIKSQSSLGYC
jgi:hypothetical protein